MLGKGLESLIPPSKSAQPGQSAQDAQTPSNPPLPDELLPAPESLPSIEAPPEEEFLPAPPPDAADTTVNGAPPAKIDIEAPNVEEISSKYAVRPAARSRDTAVFYLETDKIKPNQQQPRRNFDDEALADLAASIREFGIIQPLVVSRTEKEVPTGTEVEYELIAGERRLMAAKLAGLERVPAIVRTVDIARERLELAVIENLQRENLSPIEMARAFAKLQEEFRMTQREIATRLGKSREVVANTMRLLDLPAYIQEAIENRQVSESHGRLLLSIEDPVAQQALFHDLLNQHMTTRELRRRVASAKDKKPFSAETGAAEHEMKQIEERLKNELGAPVSIRSTGNGGKITIDFYSPEELAQIVDRFGNYDI